jgi:hypothetical protein
MKNVVYSHQQKFQHRRGEHGGFVYEFVSQAGPRKLTVIAEIKKADCWLITGWME